LTAEEKQALLEQVVAGQLNNVQRVDPKSVAGGPHDAALEGWLDIEGHTVQLRVAVPTEFPRKLPDVWLLTAIECRIPHLVEGGKICYLETSGVIIDQRDPRNVLREALQRTITTLRDGITGRNKNDFLTEFVAYWRTMSGDNKLQSAVEPSDEVRKITSFHDDKRERIFLADHRQTFAQVLPSRTPLGLTEQSAMYVPLQPGTFVYPPSGRHPWTLEFIQNLVKTNLTKENKRKLRQLATSPKPSELVVLGIPLPTGTKALVALEFHGLKGLHPLLGGQAQEPVTYLHLERHDKAYLVPRGGATQKLAQCNVLIIGCGTVGGHLPLMLAASGVGRMSLVDPDFLEPENTYRHGQGYNIVKGREAKVAALKERLQASIPYVQVDTYQERIEQVLAKTPCFLEQFDLVFVALGEPTLELWLNERVYVSRKAPPVIFTWLEPLGIGGHAVAVNVGSVGCLECLYEDGNSRKPLNFRPTFVAYGQTFQKNIDGCGGAFTPFSYLDGLETAQVAARLGTQVLRGEVKHNSIVSWKGSTTEFERAGYEASSRYSDPVARLEFSGEEFQLEGCPVCVTPR
jgi:molybdopterin-synthase adenylyltransferase